MKIDFRVAGNVDDSLLGDISSSISDVWRLSATDYYARHTAAVALKKKVPLGMQKSINQNLNFELPRAGWDGKEGRFWKDNVWLRITFRHGMSIGSDFMDGLLLAYREGVKVAVIAAPSLAFAKLVTPNDGASLVTFEKLEEYFSRAHPLFQIPLVIGKLSEGGNLERDIQRFLDLRRT